MKPFLVVFVVALVAVSFFTPVRARASAQPGELAVTVLPDQVNRYDSYSVTVIGQAGDPFQVDVFGANSFHLSFANRTDDAGVWRGNLQAWYDFGSYTFQVRANNTTSQATLVVGCNAACQASILQQNGQEQLSLLYQVVTQYGLYALLVIVAFELPRAVVYFSRQARDAKAHGQYTLKESFLSPFARLRGHINPGDNVADPRNVQNPRIAVDMERRRLMEQLHDATSKAFLEWRPGHLKNLDDIFRDLKSAWSREASIQPVAMPYAKEYVRPKPAVRISDDRVSNAAAVNVAAKRGSAGMSDQEMDTYAKDLKTERARTLRTKNPLRWAAYGVGAVGLLMALLVIGAYFGFYVDALRGLWTPFPPDSVKVVLGLSAFGLVPLTYAVTRRPRADAA